MGSECNLLLLLWLSPQQAVVCMIVSDANDYARKVNATLVEAGVRSELDLRNEKIDGRAIAESNAILCYLAGGTRYMPAADSPEGRFARAKVMQWLFFEQYYVEPVIGSLRFWTLTGRLEINSGLLPGKRDAAMRALGALERTLARDHVSRRHRLHHRGHRELCRCSPQRRLRISAGGLSRHRTLGGPGRRDHRTGLSGRPLWPEARPN
jgi:hypothetical protein